MTYDVTFHPISREQLQRLVFDPLRGKASVSEEDIHRIAGEKAADQEHFKIVLRQLQEGLATAKSSAAMGYFSYVCAALAGYLHPYWFGKKTPLKYLPDYQNTYAKWVLSVAVLAPDLFEGVVEKYPAEISQNSTGGGYIPSENIDAFYAQMVEDVKTGALSQLDLYEYAGLVFALRYAKKHDCGILEASDIYDTWKQASATRQDNLRSAIVKNDFPYINLSFPEDVADISALTKEFAAKKPEEYIEYVKGFLDEPA